MSTQTYSQRVAQEVRAEMARQGYTVTDLAAWLGRARPTAAMRLRGVTPLGLDEVETIATHLQVPIAQLLLGGVAAA